MRVLKVTWKLLLLIIIVAFGLLYYASNKMDNKYQRAKEYIQNKDWTNAASLLVETPHYKDATELYIYVYPHKLYNSKYTAPEDMINGYTKAMDFIAYEADKLKGTSSEKYYTELLELKKVLSFKIQEAHGKSIDEPQRKNIEAGVAAIKIGSYQEALTRLQQIPENSIYTIDKNEIIKYISLLNTIPLNDLEAITKKIGELNPDYQGTLGVEIKNTVNTYVDRLAWVELFNKNKELTDLTENTDKNLENDESKIPEKPNKSVIVGMLRGEVVTLLGNPLSSEKIDNKYGIYEIMTYENDRQIYLENNIVTAIR